MCYAVEGLSESPYYELGAIGGRVKIVKLGGMKTDRGGRSLDLSKQVPIMTSAAS